MGQSAPSAGLGGFYQGVQIPEGSVQRGWSQFLVLLSVMTRGHGHKLKHERFNFGCFGVLRSTMFAVICKMHLD